MREVRGARHISRHHATASSMVTASKARPNSSALSVRFKNGIPVYEKHNAALVSISSSNDFKDRLHHDLEVQRETPVVHVPNVVIDPVLHALQGRRLATKSIDLRPASDAWLHVVAEGVATDQFGIVMIVGRGMWPWSNQRHLPTYNIEKLRQLIDACPSQPCANSRHSPVASHRLPYCLAVLKICHCAKLEDLESPAIKTAPRLSEKRIPRRLKLDRNRDDDEHRHE